jgi:hypothetical protein
MARGIVPLLLLDFRPQLRPFADFRHPWRRRRTTGLLPWSQDLDAVFEYSGGSDAARCKTAQASRGRRIVYTGAVAKCGIFANFDDKSGFQ